MNANLNSNLNPEALLSISGDVWIYWKDKMGRYLGCNEKMAKDLSLSTSSDIIGMTDFDFPLSESEASFYRTQDKMVFSQENVMQFQDSAHLPHVHIHFNVLKFPYFSQSKSKHGIIGISHFIKYEPKLIQGIAFTKREIEVMQLLTRSKTAKEIAAILSISSRTVEVHVDKIKTKLNARSRSKLFEMIDSYF